MSRTDELAQTGRERGGGSGGSPFVKWGDSYTYLEGKVTGTFTTKYGLAVTMDVTKVSDRGLTGQSKNDGEITTEPVTAGMSVAVSTSPAALAGKLTEADVGRSFHIAFEGWGEGKSGNNFRVFRVIELADRVPHVGPDDHIPQDTTDYSEEHEDGLPF